MDLTIFKLEDETRRLNGDPGACDGFQHLTDLSPGQFNFLVEMVESTEDYDWR